MRINVLYFARLKQDTGLAEESVEMEGSTVRELYTQCQSLHGLSHRFEDIRAATNDAFCDGDTLLKNGDTVAFMPPMSGG
jgi:molybdopterin synthase sulfur carrier subunit